MTASLQSRLLLRATKTSGEYLRVTPETAGWQHLSFAARRMTRGQVWSSHTREDEYGLVILGGTCSVRSPRGNWATVGRRQNVFQGMPYALYLPRQTEFVVEALSPELDIAYGWCAAKESHPARLVKPSDVEIEIRGGDNVTRQINKMIPPGFPASRLIVVEVYTPSGNWSSYPPHKQDEHIVDASGKILEADLEEVYFYKINRPEGFAYQRIYTPDR